MVHKFKNLPRKQQGLFFLVIGLIVMLYALGVFGRGMNLIIVVCAALLMAFGCYKMDLHKDLIDVVKKIKHKR